VFFKVPGFVRALEKVAEVGRTCLTLSNIIRHFARITIQRVGLDGNPGSAAFAIPNVTVVALVWIISVVSVHIRDLHGDVEVVHRRFGCHYYNVAIHQRPDLTFD
jgi:hypothetical protein